MRVRRLVLTGVAVTLTASGLVAAAAGPSGAGKPPTPATQKPYELVPDGLRCGNSTFGIRELDPSIRTANATRLLRLRELQDWYAAASAACATGWYPGCDDVDAWRAQRSLPWPEDRGRNDPAEIFTDRTEILELDALLSLAAERVLAHRYCAAVSGRRGLASSGRDACASLLQAEVDSDVTLLGEKPPEDAGSTKKGAGSTKQEAGAHDAGPPRADLRDVTEFYKLIRDSPARRRWSPTGKNLAIAKAAHSVSFWTPHTAVTPGFSPAESEEAALKRNVSACPDADLYVGPNHEVVRRKMTWTASEPLSVCVDTPSFAVEEPVQVTVSTPSQKNVLLLWPGEPRHIPMELRPGARSEIVHLRVSGYPRRDLLRSLARHSGGPLASEDAFQILEKAAGAGNAEAAAKSLVGGLQDFERSAKRDPALTDALTALNDAVQGLEDAPLDAAQPAPWSSTDGGRGAGERRARGSDVKALIGKADKALNGLLLDPEIPQDVHDKVVTLVPKDEDVTAIVTPGAALALGRNVGAFFSDLDAIIQDAKAKDPGQGNFDVIADELCQLTTAVVPLVEEDLLVQPRDAAPNEHPYVVEYDFAGGFLGNLELNRSLGEDEDIFVMVRNVQPGYSVSVAIDGHAVIHRDLQLVGLSQQAINFSPDERTQTSRPGLDSFDAYRYEEQPPSTQVLALGTLAGGSRYNIEVCAAAGSGDCARGTAGAGNGGGDAGADAGAANPPPSTHVIAANSLVVHSKRHLGVRAGTGVTYDVGDFRDLVTEPGLSGSVVRQRSDSVNFSLPLLLAYYPQGRDSVGLPPRVSYGVAAGFDLTKITDTPRIYFPGTFVDIYGFGITAALTEERLSTIANPAGSVIVGSPQVDYIWQWGGYVGVTTDLDIFEAVFQQVFLKPGLPSIPDATK